MNTINQNGPNNFFLTSSRGSPKADLPPFVSPATSLNFPKGMNFTRVILNSSCRVVSLPHTKRICSSFQNLNFKWVTSLTPILRIHSTLSTTILEDRSKATDDHEQKLRPGDHRQQRFRPTLFFCTSHQSFQTSGQAPFYDEQQQQ